MKKHKWKLLNLPDPLGGVCSGMAVWGVGRAGVRCSRARGNLSRCVMTYTSYGHGHTYVHDIFGGEEDNK